jgi:hypothetical protein
MMRIGLDIDGVIADFSGGMVERLRGTEFEGDFPSNWAWGKYDGGMCSRERFETAFATFKNDPLFWLGLRPYYSQSDHPDFMEGFDFIPAMYVTARSIPSRITSIWLRRNGFPNWKNVVTVANASDKVQFMRYFALDAFVEDYHRTAVELTRAGINCYLLNRPWNINEPTPGVSRIDRLNELDHQVVPESRAA